MTVKELREMLAHFPDQDSKVYLDCEEGVLEVRSVFTLSEGYLLSDTEDE
jgi:hypothetical protein